jgi:DNA primase
LLRRYSSQVECFFDSDSAGQKAALRFLPMALKASLEVRFLTLAGAEKLDPDLLFLERGLQGYQDVQRSARSAMSFACHATLPDPSAASAEQKSRAAQALFELIVAAESEVTRAEFLAEVSAQFRLPPLATQKDFHAFATRQNRQAAARPAADPGGQLPTSTSQTGSVGATHLNTPEHHILLLCLHFESLGKPLSHAIQHDWVDTGHLPGALLNRFLAEFEQNSWPGRGHLDELLETPEERAVVANLLFETPAIDDPVKVALEGLRQLRARALEPRLRQIELALANPHADSDSDPISLLKERDKLQRQLRSPLVLVDTI